MEPVFRSLDNTLGEIGQELGSVSRPMNSAVVLGTRGTG